MPIDNETANWLRGVSESIYSKLANCGLVPARESTQLGDFVKNYIEKRTNLKPRTVLKYQMVEKRLNEYFKPDRLIGTITSGDAEDFRDWIGTQVKSENTIRKAIQTCKTIFKYAVKKELIAQNPFEGQASSTIPKDDRFHYIERDVAFAVLDACPNTSWRLLFALARFGGMRTPSEPRELKWSDIDWENKRIVVTAPKTEHHGKGKRIMPLFPELEPYLAQALKEAEEGAEYVLPQLRDKAYNPATHMLRIVEKACGQAWPKIFQNCRSTRQTELQEDFPSHVVTKWLGNTDKVAEKYYLQVRDKHFKQALEAKPDTAKQQSEAKPEAPLGDMGKKTSENNASNASTGVGEPEAVGISPKKRPFQKESVITDSNGFLGEAKGEAEPEARKQNAKQQGTAASSMNLQKLREKLHFAKDCNPLQMGAREKIAETGLEPARLAAPDPKSGVSANSTTRPSVV